MRAPRMFVAATVLMAATPVVACEDTAASSDLVASMQELLCPIPGVSDLQKQVFRELFAGFDGRGDTVDVKRLSRVLNQLELDVAAGDGLSAGGDGSATTDQLLVLLARTPALITGLRASVAQESVDPMIIARWCEWRRQGVGEVGDNGDSEILAFDEVVRCGLL